MDIYLGSLNLSTPLRNLNLVLTAPPPSRASSLLQENRIPTVGVSLLAIAFNGQRKGH